MKNNKTINSIKLSRKNYHLFKKSTYLPPLLDMSFGVNEYKWNFETCARTNQIRTCARPDQTRTDKTRRDQTRPKGQTTFEVFLSNFSGLSHLIFSQSKQIFFSLCLEKYQMHNNSINNWYRVVQIIPSVRLKARGTPA